MSPTSAYTAQRSLRYPERQRRSVSRVGVRWDRVGRLALVCVLVVLVYLYVSAGVSLLSAWHSSNQDSAQVAALDRQNATLKGERAALRRGYEAEAQARKLGMARPGETLFVVKGLPRD